MSLWTPADLAVAPLAWIHAPDAVWSGSNLSSLAGFTVVGTPTKGTAQNGIDPIRFNIGTEGLQKTFALTSGVALYFWIGARLDTSNTDYGLFGRGWPAATGVVGAFIATNLAVGQGSAFCANGYNGIINNSGDPPWLECGATNVINDTSWHSQGGVLSTSAATLWKDGVSQTITNSATGAVPSYGSGAWDFGRAGVGEMANSDFGALLFFDYALTTDERHRLEGYYHHLFNIQANLDAGHPYKNAPPGAFPPLPKPRFNPLLRM